MMNEETYDYAAAVYHDLQDAFEDEYQHDERVQAALEAGDNVELAELLQDMAWIDDSVTGNASGSYTFNSYKAESYLCHNRGLIEEVTEEFCLDTDALTSPETLDVSIRCYLLPSMADHLAKQLIYERG